MGLRLVCLFLCFVVPGWWVLIPAAGVIVLPLIAVALANVVKAPGARNATAHRHTFTSISSGQQ